MNRVYRLALPIAVLLLAACGTVATPVWSEQAQGTEAALLVTSEYQTQIAPTATPLPPTNTPTPMPPTATPIPPTAAPTEPPTAAPTLPPPTVAPAAASGSGDAEAGRELFNEVRGEVNFACATCHYVDREDMLIGPGLLNVAVRAETRVAGQTADEYLHNSILHPGDYVVEGFVDGLMPQTYADIFSDEQINNLVAYLKTLQ